MSYLTNEAATTGHAVELFQFARQALDGGGEVWRYTAHDRDVTLAGDTFRAAPIRREAIRRGDGGAKATLRVTCPTDLPLLLAWRSGGPGLPDAPLLLQVRRTYVDASGAAVVGDTAALFVGTVDTLEREGTVATLTCASLGAGMARPVPRAAMQRQCNWALFDHRCGLERFGWVQPGTVTAVEAGGTLVTATMDFAGPPERADGLLSVVDATYFDGGLLSLPMDPWPTLGREFGRVGIVDARWTTWPTVTFRLLSPLVGLVVGSVITASAGDDYTFKTCRARFNNARRFGGFPDLPDRDPLRDGVG